MAGLGKWEKGNGYWYPARKRTIFHFPIAIFLLLAACSSEPPPADVVDPATSVNPLEACPRPTNCERETRLYAEAPEALFERAEAALQSMNPVETVADIPAREVSAVFRVFVFKDDVTVAVTPHEEGSALHIRSASRTGRNDFGVNRKRVNEFYAALDGRD